MSDSAIARLYRRVMMMVGRGKVTVVDDTGPVQKLQLGSLSPLEVRDNTPRLAEYGFTSNLQPGADAIVLFVGGDRSNGVVIATGDQRYRLKSLAPGEVALYTDEGDKVVMKRGHVIEIDTQTLTINATTIVTVNTPLLKVSGDIQDEYGTNTRTMAGMRTQYNAHHHGDPQGGTTGVPDALM